MKVHFLAYLVPFLAVTALNGALLDDKIKAFEDAVGATLPIVDDLNGNSRAPTVEELNTVIQRGDNGASVEALVTRLMATHPSPEVQKTGQSLIGELEKQRKVSADAFELKAHAVLAKAQETVRQAKAASDLDQTLKDLQALQPQGGFGGMDATPEMAGKVSAAFQFVTQWQDYLGAVASGNMQEAQNNLRMLLGNRQIGTPLFLPRSELLARMADARAGKRPTPAAPASPDASPSPEATDPDPILKKIRTPDDFTTFLGELLHVPSPDPQVPWNWSWLVALDKTRLDAVAGLPVTVDLRGAVHGAVWGDHTSRIEAMELLGVLPYYLGTHESAPPKVEETLSGYLDRLSVSANKAGDLALLQRVIAVKLALATPKESTMYTGTQEFLAGLSQDAAGQYAPAVISYENALKAPDNYLPVKIVGDRLAAIKAAHPDEFEKGLTIFMTPAPINPNMYGGMPSYYVPGRPGGNGVNFVTILPIPGTVSIPARTSAPPTAKPSPAGGSPQPPAGAE